MEDTIDDTSDSTVDINILVVPCCDELRNNPRNDLRCDLSSWLVENLSKLEVFLKRVPQTYVGEMILRQHRMSWVCAAVILEDDKLLVPRALDDLRRACV